MTDAPTPETPRQTQGRVARIRSAPWYYFTRALGAMMVVYGLFFDKSDIRGEIILTGAGLAGYDKVARSEPGGAGGG